MQRFGERVVEGDRLGRFVTRDVLRRRICRHVGTVGFTDGERRTDLRELHRFIWPRWSIVQLKANVIDLSLGD